MTAKLSRPQRRALEDLERGATLIATHPTVIAALHKRGLITSDGQDARLTDAGRARLDVKRGRKPGGPTLAAREFAARQLTLPLEVRA